MRRRKVLKNDIREVAELRDLQTRVLRPLMRDHPKGAETRRVQRQRDESNASLTSKRAELKRIEARIVRGR